MHKKNKATGQTVILVDDNDKFLGRYAPRHKAHSGRGLHHRAFVCMIIDNKGRILLQKRKHWLWDNLWDLSAISHTLHFPDYDESYEEATARALKKEMGIVNVKTKKIGGFNYYEKHPKDKRLPAGRQGCENEYCGIMFGRYNGPVKPDKEDVYEYRWMDSEEFRKSVKKNPSLYTPWLKLALQTLEKDKRLTSLI